MTVGLTAGTAPGFRVGYVELRTVPKVRLDGVSERIALTGRNANIRTVFINDGLDIVDLAGSSALSVALKTGGGY